MKRLKDLNWNHLYYFYEVARLHSIKEVSKFTNHSPSTISEQIKKLEEKLDAPLFRRAKTGLFLTPKGEVLFEHARIIFEEGYRVLEKFSDNDVGGYPVTVGVDQAILDPISSDFITMYWDQYAKFGVVNTVKQGDHDVLIQNIREEHLDWGLSLTPSKRKTLTSYPIGSYSLSFCCAKFIYDEFKQKEDIVHYLPYIEGAIDHPFKNKVNSFLRSVGIEFNEYSHTDNFTFMLSLIENGRAFTLLPEILIKTHKNLKGFHFDDQFTYPIYAIWKNSNEELIPISLLKSMALTGLLRPKTSPFLQLDAVEVPKEKLKSKSTGGK